MESGGRVIFEGAVLDGEKSQDKRKPYRDSKRLFEYNITALPKINRSSKFDCAGTSRLAVCKTAGMSNSVI